MNLTTDPRLYRHTEPWSWKGPWQCSSGIFHLFLSEASAFFKIPQRDTAAEKRVSRWRAANSAPASHKATILLTPVNSQVLHFILFGKGGSMLKRDLNAPGLLVLFIWQTRELKPREVTFTGPVKIHSVGGTEDECGSHSLKGQQSCLVWDSPYGWCWPQCPTPILAVTENRALSAQLRVGSE